MSTKADTKHVATKDTIKTNEQIKNEPDIKCIERRRLCHRALWSFYLSYISKTGILFLLFVVGVFFEPILFGSMLLVYVFMLYLVAAIVHQNYYFEVNETSFRKSYGVVHKNDITIPFNRIQNVNIIRSLSDRVLGLARIDIETAGSVRGEISNISGGSSSTAEGHLPGVTLSQAEEIHDLLLDRFAQIRQSVPDSVSP
ncbi:hypothetical protein BH23PAT2_BH23PAT2_06200 [soil metagenome]